MAGPVPNTGAHKRATHTTEYHEVNAVGNSTGLCDQAYPPGGEYQRISGQGRPSAEVTFELSWAGEELPFAGHAGRARQAAGQPVRRLPGRALPSLPKELREACVKVKAGAGAGAGRTV